MNEAEQRTAWNLRQVAAWLKGNSPHQMSLNDAWRMADQLCKGPLADVWNDGVNEGQRRKLTYSDE